MRKLMAVLMAVAVLWAGYWFVGHRTVQSAFVAWFADQRAAGLTADYADLSTIGFPSRFDTTITQVRLGSPMTGISWSAPFVQFLALSYRPNKFIVVWPNTQTLELHDQTISVTSDKMLASVTVQPGTALILDHSELVASKINLTSSLGWMLSLDMLRFATRPTLARNDAHDIGLQLLGMTLPKQWLEVLTPDGSLPANIENLRIDTSVGFDAPWALRASEQPSPAITGIDVKTADVTWGQMNLHATGKLEVDDQGYLKGQLDVEATNWRQMYGLVGASGVVASGFVMPIERVLESMAAQSGSADTITAPLVFNNGFVSFGPIPLGPSPLVRPQT